MKNLSLDQIKAILESGDFDQLNGAIEDETLECKSAPYQIEHDHHKMELAKDVSALANAAGGIILLGVETAKNPIHPVYDIITEVSPFKRDLVSTESYIDIVKKWVYPRPENVDTRWFPSQSDKGILGIFVPTQSKTKWPFLITKIPDDRGKNRTIVFGLPSAAGLAQSLRPSRKFTA